jgi:hypothetical protein
MVLSCGTLLHHAAVVLAVLGTGVAIERIDDPADPVLLARLTLTGPHAVTADDMRLHHALRLRRTDRRPFRGTGPLPESVVHLLRAAAAPYGVATHVFDPEQLGFLALAAREAAHIHAKSESYRDEIQIQRQPARQFDIGEKQIVIRHFLKEVRDCKFVLTTT